MVSLTLCRDAKYIEKSSGISVRWVRETDRYGEKEKKPGIPVEDRGFGTGGPQAQTIQRGLEKQVAARMQSQERTKEKEREHRLFFEHPLMVSKTSSTGRKEGPYGKRSASSKTCRNQWDA